jgi:hypothetical protein
MSKGSNDRTDNKDNFNKGHERAFGKRKPWWELRDERKAKEAKDKK